MQAMASIKTLHPDSRYLVVGLGLTGYSVARYLLQHGYACKAIDDRAQPPYAARLKAEFPMLEILQQPLQQSLLNDVDCLVVSPGLSIRSGVIKKASESGKRIIGDIQLFAEAVQQPVLAITGSNGKSTVTALLGEMIRADGHQVGVGGNIGVPALDLLQQAADYYVLELSSFQLETVQTLAPLASTVLNVSEDHLDRYQGLSDYQQTKHAIYHNAHYCISNADDASTWRDERDIRFSINDEQADYSLCGKDKKTLCIHGKAVIDVDDIKLKGRHNQANCLAAMALADVCGISHAAMAQAMKSFTGLPHRSQWIAQRDGVSWINDSKATNPGAAKAAIEGQSAPVVLIAGGQSKGANVETLCPALRQHVKKVLLMGQDADLIQQAWQNCVEIERVDDMTQAVQRARQIAQPGDLVMLSPACASFDMYTGFEARGDHFAELVRALS